MQHVGMFPHECEHSSCSVIVQLDDEPFCFEHSSDEGSFVPGYSARAKRIEKMREDDRVSV